MLALLLVNRLMTVVMHTLPLRLVVVAHREAPHVQNAWKELEAFLATQADVEVLEVFQENDPELAPPETDLVVVLGGDGAILRACRQMGHRQHPILGVNLGRLGFLADLSPGEFMKNFERIRRREFRIVHHLMFDCELTRSDGTTETHLGLNEVVVAAGAALRLFDVKLEIDDELVTTYSGDGLIVSTPVGSTAHSLSAGGPILRQALQAFVITPICPHTLTIRPVVDSADCVYRLSVDEIPEGVTMVVDGQVLRPLAAGDRIEIRRAAVTFQLAKVPGHSYYGTLHRKLGWAGHPIYRRVDRPFE